jgi:hypothetical protein
MDAGRVTDVLKLVLRVVRHYRKLHRDQGSELSVKWLVDHVLSEDLAKHRRLALIVSRVILFEGTA